jgi:SAM-dependent methyltransferase
MTITAWLRWDAIERLLPDRAARVLDIGAGTGSIGAMLARRYDYVGIEPDPVSFATAERRVGRLGTLLNCAWEDLPAAADFDLVCAFEVLEHIRDDREALASWMDHLRPGASLLVSVPSGTRRYGPANARVGDLRRYDESALLALLSSLGLRGLQARRYGAPYGHVQEALLNALAGDDADESMAERTAASARSMQPPRVFSYAVAAVALPLRLVQRPLARVGLGTGLVCRGDKRLPPTRSG